MSNFALLTNRGGTGGSGAQGPPGPGVINWRSAWSATPSPAYALNDAVSDDGSSYICITANTTKEPGVTSSWEDDWDILALHGSQGEKGDKGDDGNDGIDGNRFLSGAGAPSDILGNDDDYYLDSDNGDLYHKVTGSWGSPIANLTGPVGAKGDKGDDGDGWDQWQGDYDNGTAYVKNDVVFYLGSSYIALDSTTGNLPTDTDHWHIVAQRGDDGSDGSDGSDGLDGGVFLLGHGPPSDADGNDGDLYIDEDTDDVYHKTSGTWGSPAFNIKGNPGNDGSDGGDGSDGSDGVDGVNGGGITLEYRFSTTTTDSDPGDGNLRLSESSNQDDSLIIRADLKDINGISWQGVLDILDDSTSSNKGYLRLVKKSDPSAWIVFTLSSVDSSTGYRNLSVTPIWSSTHNPFSDTDTLVFTFTRTGDKGDKGDDGSKGDKGDTGDPWDQWQGAYNGATSYVVNDAVSFNGSSYICTNATTGNDPTDPSFWDLIAEKGDDGATGLQGQPGGANTFKYTFSTTTTDSDPGSGVLRLNNATQNLANTIYIDLNNSDGDDLTTFLDSLDDSTNTVKGHIKLVSTSDFTHWILFTISTVTTASGYRKLSVTVVDSSTSSPFSNGNSLYFEFTRAGDQGSTGSTGAAGFTLIPTATKTANYTAVTGDLVECNLAGGGFTITTPASPNNGDIIGVYIANHLADDSSTAMLTIGSGAIPIHGYENSPYYQLWVKHEFVVLCYNSTLNRWQIVSERRFQIPQNTQGPSGDYTALSGDVIFCGWSTTADHTITLPINQFRQGDRVVVKNQEDRPGHPVVIDSQGNHIISLNGDATTLDLQYAGESVELFHSASNFWQVI